MWVAFATHIFSAKILANIKKKKKKKQQHILWSMFKLNVNNRHHLFWTTRLRCLNRPRLCSLIYNGSTIFYLLPWIFALCMFSYIEINLSLYNVRDYYRQCARSEQPGSHFLRFLFLIKRSCHIIASLVMVRLTGHGFWFRWNLFRPFALSLGFFPRYLPSRFVQNA